MGLFAIGDIHGCYPQFCALLDKLKLAKTDKLVLLGDYVDRGLQSKEVLDKIIELKESGFEVVPLLGNHEYMMLQTIQQPQYFDMWMINGGWSTLQSFGCENPNEIDDEYIDLLSDMPLYHVSDNFIFVHAGFDDEVEDPYSNKEAMLWSRKEEYNKAFIKEHIVLHGHTPIPVEKLRSNLKSGHNVINIDTGCVYTHRAELGNLTAICLDSFTLFSVKNN